MPFRNHSENCMMGDMTTRIPPSLKWLINKRARLLGDIAKAEKELIALPALKEKQLTVLRQDLTVIDNTIRLHDIPIDPDLIQPINGHDKGRFLKHGNLTRSILACLKHFHPKPVTTTEIAIIIGEKLGIDCLNAEFPTLRTSVRYRLKNMCKNGSVARVHVAATRQKGTWNLSDKTILKSKQIRDQ